MKRRPRIYYSAGQRALMWEHWRKGETLHQIARLFDRYHSSVHRILAKSGGIRPAERHRSKSALTLIEREEISRGIVEGRSTRVIAAALGRAPSTISREIRRNDGLQGYRASQADQAAWDRGCRPKVCKLGQNRELAQLVASKLRLEWSPEQVAGWLKHSNPDDEAFQVSHETIYRSLFIQARGALKKELMAHCGAPEVCVVRGTIRRRPASTGKSLTRYRSASVPLRSKIVRFLATGKVTCCLAARTARSRHSLNVNHVT